MSKLPSIKHAADITGKQKFSRLEAIRLYSEGYTQVQIAEILGVNQSTISQGIAKYLPDRDKVAVMQVHKADHINALAYDVMDAIRGQINGTSDKSNSLKDLNTTLKDLLTSYQLITGAATSLSKCEVKHTGAIDDNVIDITTLQRPDTPCNPTEYAYKTKSIQDLIDEPDHPVIDTDDDIPYNDIDAGGEWSDD